MSQFRDTFTKEEQGESLYDDSAFFFFSEPLFLCPTRKFNKREYPKHSSKGSYIQYCKCSACTNRVDNIRKAHRSFSHRFSWTAIIQTIMLILLWYLTCYMMSAYSMTKRIAQFDPYEILEITSTASTTVIRKAYRLMSLKYHPDKNPNDPTAAAKFMLIAKAYQALTDDLARSNYEKYGNPDGPATMKVGIGLPSFLVSKKYQLLILCLFSLILLFVIPLIFICYYRRQRRYASNGVHLTTLYFFSAAITDSTRFKALPELLALSTEFRSLSIKNSEDEKIISKFAMELSEFKKRSFTANSPNFGVVYYLILAHLHRKHNELTPSLKKYLDKILYLSMPLTLSMLEISISRDFFHTTMAILSFRRALIQALDGSPNSAFLQIPYITDNEIYHIKKGRNAAKTLVDFINQNSSERKGLADLTEDQKMDIDAFCYLTYPIVVSTKVSVDDEEDIVVGDLVTIDITLNRSKLDENEAIGPIHSPYFSGTKYEEWWIFAITKGSNPHILGNTRCTSNEKFVEGKIQFLLETPGNIEISIVIANDSYEGLDQQINVSFIAKSIKDCERTIFVHPEDEALDNEPTLFQHIMNQLDDHQLSTDTEDEYEDEDEEYTNNSKFTIHQTTKDK